jgi:2-methylisocitrate lyase-like PEP mutase family enzyme
MRDHAEMIANLSSSLPLIADMDTGYGGPINVARNTAAYIRSGVAGFHIEDQVQSKRCGHLKGKELVSTDVFLSRIRAAVSTRKKLNSDIVVIARTDALQSLGYNEAISRLKAARDAGADVAFFEGMTSKEMCRQAIRDLHPFAMLLNMVEHGATPTIAREEAREMGIRIMIWPFAALAPAYVAMRNALRELKDVGSMPSLKEALTPRNLFEVCGLEESMRIDEEAGGLAFQEGA